MGLPGSRLETGGNGPFRKGLKVFPSLRKWSRALGVLAVTVVFSSVIGTLHHSHPDLPGPLIGLQSFYLLGRGCTTWGFSHEARRGSQGASRAVPGKSGLCARVEGERVMALQSWERTRASRGVEEGHSRSFTGWGMKPLVPSTCAGAALKGETVPDSLGLALGSPIFPSGCEGKLGVALESLQGRRDLI